MGFLSGFFMPGAKWDFVTPTRWLCLENFGNILLKGRRHHIKFLQLSHHGMCGPTTAPVNFLSTGQSEEDISRPPPYSDQLSSGACPLWHLRLFEKTWFFFFPFFCELALIWVSLCCLDHSMAWQNLFFFILCSINAWLEDHLCASFTQAKARQIWCEMFGREVKTDQESIRGGKQ